VEAMPCNNCRLDIIFKSSSIVKSAGYMMQDTRHMIKNQMFKTKHLTTKGTKKN